MSYCKSTVNLPQNAVLGASDVTDIKAAANIFLTTPSVGASMGRNFKSSADYLRYKKAGVFAGSTPNPVLPPQAVVITQLQASGKC
jgi:hypothetical protein